MDAQLDLAERALGLDHGGDRSLGLAAHYLVWKGSDGLISLTSLST